MTMQMAARAPLVIVMIAWATALAPPDAVARVRTDHDELLGPPTPLRGLRVGESVRAWRTVARTGARRDFDVTRLAAAPHLFHLRDMLDASECDEIVDAARATPRRSAETVGGTSGRTHCDVAWLSPAREPAVAALARDGARLLLGDGARRAGGGCEDLQVLRYAPAGEFTLHHDAGANLARALSVLVYLNDGGETWFPLARGDAAGDAGGAPANRVAALEAAARVEAAGEGGVRASPAKGDAVAFYNLDARGRPDWRALHAGVRAEREKWVGALWFHVAAGEGASGR